MNSDYLSAVHPTIRQRYYNILCIAMGSDPIEFSSFIPDNMKVSDVNLPYGRLASCTGELEAARKVTWTDYNKVGAAFAELILPHVDLDLLRKVQNTKWLPDDQ